MLSKADSLASKTSCISRQLSCSSEIKLSFWDDFVAAGNSGRSNEPVGYASWIVAPIFISRDVISGKNGDYNINPARLYLIKGTGQELLLDQFWI